jgi:DNA-binding HxlR family transcriptional regulator
MALRSGDLRRRDLRERIGGISDKSLTASLTRLVSAGLVHRTTHAEAPPRVQYMLTDRGISFMDGPLVALGAWTLGSASTAQSGSHAVDQP